jgi:hypothetical protein
MGDDKKIPINIGSFLPAKPDRLLRAFRPLDTSGTSDKPFDSGGGSVINKPVKPKGKPIPGKG